MIFELCIVTHAFQKPQNHQKKSDLGGSCRRLEILHRPSINGGFQIVKGDLQIEYCSLCMRLKPSSVGAMASTNAAGSKYLLIE